ncbi:hypothetical protein [Sphaerospermopsis sp. LEGE 08334]|uniref:hypothetical protein n=1 Tax=Sphaerospermopsis sp. LEGE 08334 TaxID=1828651 RepID=UPI00187FE81E|nr:hypothetical protein [Sphaerospermopsis sp. LEGE 08334]MBE9057612.1 hypothetical protein [Sphaerospermopsis sp. LEGE 08334]
MKSLKYILMIAICCISLFFAESALADPPRYTKNPDYIALTKQLNQLETAQATQTPPEGYTLEQLDQIISDLELQKLAFESGIDWGQCSNQTGKTLAIYGPEPNLEEDDYSEGAALYFLGDNQTTKNKWNCKGIYFPVDVKVAALGLDGQSQELTGGIVIKVANGTKLVLRTNPDTGAIEFNQGGTQIFKPGEINWFIPNVSQAVVDARVTNAPAKKA